MLIRNMTPFQTFHFYIEHPVAQVISASLSQLFAEKCIVFPVIHCNQREMLQKEPSLLNNQDTCITLLY